MASSPPPAPVNPPPAIVHASERVTVTRLQTGWVAVKRRFREQHGPDWWRLPAIVLDRRWTEWLPIHVFAIEHGEGTLLFDTGETARVAEHGWFDCDAATGWFYRHQLRFAVTPDDEIGPQLMRAGIEPARVDDVILSHLHSDHIGGLAHVTSSRWFLSARDALGHAGALRCRMPAHDDTVQVVYDDGPFGAFAASHALTDDGTVRIVPTPGHTPGHQSVLIQDGEAWVLLAGDVVFDRKRLDAGRAQAGIVEIPMAARDSIDVVTRQLREHDTRLFAAHDGGHD